MSYEEDTLLQIKGLIASLPTAQREACDELADHLRRVIANAEEPVGTLALALVGTEAQLKSA